ncbi:MAG: hypothetical protein EBU90_08215 [Proteobacteria bacterium]|nr:hypothetical protein [Pseudomonadota bacterium]NBP14237.1 hypothetical protein [bacterium]
MNQLEKEFEFIRKIYRDVLNGYTSITIKSRNYFFKHLTDLEQTACNNIFVKEFNNAKLSGLLEEKDKIKILEDSGHWSREKEEKIKRLQEEIGLLNITKSKLIIKAQIEFIDKKINKIKFDLNELLTERGLLLGLTAEDFAKKKSNEYILYITIYKDSDLNDRYFKNMQEFEDVEPEELLSFFIGYKDILDDLSGRNIKKIAAMPFFLNSFFLAKDSTYNFFGKPIINLTKYQLELFMSGKQYQSVLVQSKSTPSTYDSLDELVDWYDNQGLINANAGKTAVNNKMANTYVGANKEEIKKIVGREKDTIDLLEETKKIGKDLNFEELLKIHGEN